MKDKQNAIFLDRDGVINKEVNYLSNPDDFVLLEGTIDALKILKEKGYLLIIITNQAGIARGYFSETTLNQIHKKMNLILNKNKIFLDDILFCPHHPMFTDNCECRKPNPGMILKAKKKFNINLKDSFMVGDTINDIKAGKNAGCKTVLVLTGHGVKEREKLNEIKPDYIYKNLLEFAENIKFK